MRVSGFSLIELMVVIGVIALINIVMLPNFTNLTISAKAMSAKSTTRNIMVGIEQYYFLNQSYPTVSGGSINTLLSDLIAAGFIDTMPTNPFTGQVYSDSDDSGRLIYRSLSADAYEIELYGSRNEQLIFNYP